MPAFRGLPRILIPPPQAVSSGGVGGGVFVGSPPPAPIVPSIPVYKKSTTNADGSTDTFSFTPPILSLIQWDVGGIVQDPVDASVVAGELKIEGTFSPLPGDPSNPTLVRIGALYIA